MAKDESTTVAQQSRIKHQSKDESIINITDEKNRIDSPGQNETIKLQLGLSRSVSEDANDGTVRNHSVSSFATTTPPPTR